MSRILTQADILQTECATDLRRLLDSWSAKGLGPERAYGILIGSAFPLGELIIKLGKKTLEKQSITNQTELFGSAFKDWANSPGGKQAQDMLAKINFSPTEEEGE